MSILAETHLKMNISQIAAQHAALAEIGKQLPAQFVAQLEVNLLETLTTKITSGERIPFAAQMLNNLVTLARAEESLSTGIISDFDASDLVSIIPETLKFIYQAENG